MTDQKDKSSQNILFIAIMIAVSLLIFPILPIATPILIIIALIIAFIAFRDTTPDNYSDT